MSPASAVILCVVLCFGFVALDAILTLHAVVLVVGEQVSTVVGILLQAFGWFLSKINETVTTISTIRPKSPPHSVTLTHVYLHVYNRGGISDRQ